jgi:hypothetical protein
MREILKENDTATARILAVCSKETSRRIGRSVTGYEDMLV